MKSLFKVALLVTTVVISTHITQAVAAEASKPAETTLNALGNKSEVVDDKKSAYALGASLGSYMRESLKEQEKLDIKLDKDQLIAGVQDAFAGNSKLTDEQTKEVLLAFETRVKASAQAKMELEARKNAEEGKKYSDEFAKETGVKKTPTNLLYKIEKSGAGTTPKNSDTVVVNYVGKLIDGTEFDNSHTRGQPLSFRLDGVIAGWTEGLKHVKKGGKIKLVIPPELAYGERGVPGIPANSTLVFDVELLDIKAAPKAEKSAKISNKSTAK